VTVLTAINWDLWRTDYDVMTFRDQQRFYRIVAEQHPVQQTFNPQVAADAFDLIGGTNLRVAEVGGWDGLLAAIMLKRGDVATWLNYDLITVPQVCKHPGYQQVELDGYLWNRGAVTGDVFVACHTIEHLRARQLDQLFRCLRTRWVYLEAPLDDEPTDWAGFEGSHILEIGWEGVEELLNLHGYENVAGGQGAGLWVQR
jgi:hypothetical protein